MHQIIPTVFHRVLEACGSDVTLGIPVALEFSIHAGDHHVVPDVKLSFEVQEGTLEVFLDNKSS